MGFFQTLGIRLVLRNFRVEFNRLVALVQFFVQIGSAETVYRPSSLVPIDEGQAGRLMRLIEVLEENDDVDAVHANFDVPAEVLERVAG